MRATATVAGSPYSITASDAAGSGLASYAISYQPGTLTVTPAGLTVSANDASRVYGANNPAFTATVAGVQNHDQITVNFTCDATPESPIGTYPIVPELADDDGLLANYQVTTNNGMLTVLIPDAIITSPTVAGQVLSLSVATAPGLTYVLEFTDSLVNPSWQIAQTLPGTGDLITFTSQTTDSSTRFFRIRAE